MKRSDDRILTTHVGSLPRPQALLDAVAEVRRGGDRAAFEAVLPVGDTLDGDALGAGVPDVATGDAVVLAGLADEDAGAAGLAVADATTFVDTAATPETTYTYRVRAEGPAGASRSSALAVRVRTSLAAPSPR